MSGPNEKLYRTSLIVAVLAVSGIIVWRIVVAMAVGDAPTTPAREVAPAGPLHHDEQTTNSLF